MKLLRLKNEILWPESEAQHTTTADPCISSDVRRGLVQIAMEMAKEIWIFDEKCRDDGELPLKNDDF